MKKLIHRNVSIISYYYWKINIFSTFNEIFYKVNKISITKTNVDEMEFPASLGDNFERA